MDLWPALTEARRLGAGWQCWTGERFEWTTWQATIASARGLATHLRAAGVRPGSRVATVLTNSPLAVRGLLAIWFAGATVASLPVAARGMSLEEYRDQLIELSRRLDAQLLMLDEQLVALLAGSSPSTVRARSWESLRELAPLDPEPPAADELAFVQYSSGSTSMPKGCMLTARAIGAQLEIIAAATDSTAGAEVVCSWLPLSHDMGAFGCLLLSLAWDFDLVLSSPERFMRNPRTWLGDCADSGATMTAGTSTALGAATRAHRASSIKRPLRLRTAVLGAERVDWGTLQSAIETFGPHGLSPMAFLPAYGLAEATLVVTASGVREEPSMLAVDSVALADGEIVPADASAATTARILDLGPPCAGCEVRLGRDGALTEIEVASASLACGYLADPARTAERFHDGFFRTGDLGFLRDGRLYVVGRHDDMICVGGRNVYAREIETAVDRLPTVRTGCTTIVDVPDGPETRLVMLTELRDGAGDYAELTATAARIATATAGVSLSECVFLPRGMLPKTPSGKIQRFRCRQLVSAEALEPTARVSVRGGPGLDEGSSPRRRAAAPEARAA